MYSSYKDKYAPPSSSKTASDASSDSLSQPLSLTAVKEPVDAGKMLWDAAGKDIATESTADPEKALDEDVAIETAAVPGKAPRSMSFASVFFKVALPTAGVAILYAAGKYSEREDE